MSKHIGSVKLTVKQFSAVFRSVENHSVRWLRVKNMPLLALGEWDRSCIIQ